ncbi:MAG TPA: M23 family metallopeptidase [Terriglobales bacterium]|nr:M23 family metallopeptidase [Terriglobales bacterium]
MRKDSEVRSVLQGPGFQPGRKSLEIDTGFSRWGALATTRSFFPEHLWRRPHSKNATLFLTMRVQRVASLLLFFLAVCLAPAQEKPPAKKPTAVWTVRATPPRPVNGAPVFLEVTPPARLQSLAATWLGHSVTFSPSAGKTWFALAGTSLETKPGSYPLALVATTTSGSQIRFPRNLTIGRAKYPVIRLTVSKEFTEPNPEQQQKIQADQQVKHQTFAQPSSPDREWSGSFAPPVNAPVSDLFGVRRVFNGVTKSVHQGLDYRVPPGTPVAAVNSGTVLLARPLYFEGNCVMLDHGQGLITLYLHLSEIDVKEGDHVERGQLLGRSGASGRATGPHLHLAVRWQGVYLNPAGLLALHLPDSAAQNASPAN